MIGKGIPAKLASATIWLSIIIGLATQSTNNPFKLSFQENRLQAAADQSSPVYLLVTVLWEGRSLHAYNIDAIQKLRREFPGISITHLIDPAYFLKPKTKPNIVRAKIKSTMSPNDTIGLYSHAWKSVVESAGVPFRTNPTFWGAEPTNCRHDCGSEVPLTAYSKEEVNKIVDRGKTLLTENSFAEPKVFKAGGWQANQTVFDVVAGNGFDTDYSAVSPHLLAKKLGGYPIFSELNQLWHDRDPYGQPYLVAGGGKEIFQAGHMFPVDYLPSSAIVNFFKALISKQEQTPELALSFHLAIHQESARKYYPRMRESLNRIFKLSEELNLIPFSLPNQIGTLASNVKKKAD